MRVKILVPNPPERTIMYSGANVTLQCLSNINKTANNYTEQRVSHKEQHVQYYGQINPMWRTKIRKN